MNDFRISFALLFFIFLSYASYSQSFETLYEIPSRSEYSTTHHLATASSQTKQYEGLSKSTTLSIDQTMLKSLSESKSSLLSLTLPADDGAEVTLLLKEIDITQPGYQLLAKSGTSTSVIKDTNRHYRGIVEGKPESKVTVTLNDEELMAMVIDKKSQRTLARLKDSESYIYYDTNDLLVSAGFECGADGLQEFANESSGDAKMDTDNCVGMYVESGYEIYLDKGTLTATSLYLTGLFNQVSALYAAESINLNIQELVIWTTEDPYTGPSSYDKLLQFQNGLNGQFNGDLAHFIDYSNGGIAYINTLCFDQYAVGYSGITSYYADIPVYSWSAEVLTHEIGHNLGSPHTHACAWNGNNTAIDGCGAAIGAGEGCDGPIPVKGTIMSYCHLVTGVGIDFNLGLGAQPGDLIRNNVYNSSCLTACSIDNGCQTIGQSCDDNDPCTIDDIYDADCLCVGTYTDVDGDGYCAGDDPDDTDFCNPDNTGPDCEVTIVCVDFDYTTLEYGYGIWNDGGSDCIKSLSANYTYEGTYSILIRDNSNGASSTYTDDLPVSGVDELQLDFVYYPFSMEYGEDFLLEISLNGGSQYTLVKSWVSGQDFSNGQFYMESVTISGYQLTDNTRLRLRCDASANSDRIYLDNLLISVCNQGVEEDNCTLTGQSCDDGDDCTEGETYDLDCNCTGGISTDADADGICTAIDPNDSDPCIPNINHPLCDQCETEGQSCDDGDPCTLGEVYDGNCDCVGGLYTDSDLDGYCVGNDLDDSDPCLPDPSACVVDPCNDFDVEDYDQSMGMWNDGGTDCLRISNTNYATSGRYSIRIRDNSGVSSSVYSDNINASNAQSIEVSFSFKANSMETNEDFFLELSSNGGTTYSLIEDWKSGTDFNNNVTYTVSVEINPLVPFSSNTRLRFRCDASTNSDQVYIDDVTIKLCGLVSTDDIIAMPISQIRLYDLYGRLHLSQDVIDQQEVYSLDIGETQTGTYLVLVTAGDQTWPHKIIIQ